MSIELPEAKILAEQMNKELHGKRVKTYRLQDYERLQRAGLLNKDIRSFEWLVNAEVEGVTSRGNTIRVKLNNEVNLVLAPEYGGEIIYHTGEKAISGKAHEN